ncbi:hypothetical protein CFOL_v3_06622, partial [Cephalotus follicularis]
NPFSARRYGAHWYKRMSLLESQGSKLYFNIKSWSDIQQSQDLCIMLSNGHYLEPYIPAQLARQFGMVHGVLIPFYLTLNAPWEKRLLILNNILWEAGSRNTQRLMNLVNLKQFVSLCLTTECLTYGKKLIGQHTLSLTSKLLFLILSFTSKILRRRRLKKML